MNKLSKVYSFDWKALIEEQRISGMNMKVFCQKNNIPYHAFKNHKYKLRDSGSDPTLFLPVKPETNDNVEFILNGNRICFDASTDDQTVSRIIKALLI